MRQRGFTLVELMVVIGITMLLLTWGIPAFSTWSARRNVEGEIARLYNDLQYARMTAYATKNLTGIYWGGGANINQYQIVTNTNPNATSVDAGTTPVSAAVSTHNNPLAFTCTPLAAQGTQQSVSFDGRGLLYTGNANDNATQVIFSIPQYYGAGTNCVEVTLTSIALGKLNGNSCDSPR